jgi:hypothetical protein
MEEQTLADLKSALSGFKAAIGLVDDVDPALSAHQAIITVPTAQGFQGIADFHDNLRLLFCRLHTQPTQPCQRKPPERWLGTFHCSTVRNGSSSRAAQP